MAKGSKHIGRSEVREAKAYCDLSRRERQIVELLYQYGEATAREIHAGLRKPPSYSAIRATLRILELKGNIKHKEKGLRYVFRPADSRLQARRLALRDLITKLFDDSIDDVLQALLDSFATELTHTDIDRLVCMLEHARPKLPQQS